MRLSLTLLLLTLGPTASAHTGHIGQSAGHNHLWVGLGAILIAGIVAGIKARKAI